MTTTRSSPVCMSPRLLPFQAYKEGKITFTCVALPDPDILVRAGAYQMMPPNPIFCPCPYNFCTSRTYIHTPVAEHSCPLSNILTTLNPIPFREGKKSRSIVHARTNGSSESVARPTRRPSTHPARGASKIARPSSHVAARDGKESSAHMHMPPALPGATTKPDQARAARSGGRWNLAILDGGQSAAGLDALRSNSPCVCMRACRSSFYFGLCLPGAAGQWNVCAKLKYAYINLARASRKDQGGGFPLSRPRQIRNWRWLN
jgi:hypothetical protein